MKLILFDIDGTLTQTSRVDELSFNRAFAELHGVENSSVHWADCPHVSDSGITQHLFQSLFGREPRAEETDALRSRLVHQLEAHHQTDRAWFAEIPGAPQTFNRHATERNWSRALATGCWRPSAEMKLRAAGIACHGVPGGFAEDGLAREAIVRAAIERAHAHYERDRFDRIVSVGDGVWDVRTAANLGLPFVGVAEGEGAARLRAAGARHIIEHFEDVDRFFAYLDAAETPGF
jgi:phosphoglycolate phosphatase-like HAD superfamily hydrolase